MPVNHEEDNRPIALFAEHGLDAYIKSTRSLLVLLLMLAFVVVDVGVGNCFLFIAYQ